MLGHRGRKCKPSPTFDYPTARRRKDDAEEGTLWYVIAVAVLAFCQHDWCVPGGGGSWTRVVWSAVLILATVTGCNTYTEDLLLPKPSAAGRGGADAGASGEGGEGGRDEEGGQAGGGASGTAGDSTEAGGAGGDGGATTAEGGSSGRGGAGGSGGQGLGGRSGGGSNSGGVSGDASGGTAGAVATGGATRGGHGGEGGEGESGVGNLGGESTGGQSEPEGGTSGVGGSGGVGEEGGSGGDGGGSGGDGGDGGTVQGGESGQAGQAADGGQSGEGGDAGAAGSGGVDSCGTEGVSIIDDMEDSDNAILACGARWGYWYSFLSLGTVEALEPDPSDQFTMVELGEPVSPVSDSVMGAHFAASGLSGEAALGLSLYSPLGTNLAYDLSPYLTLRFWYRTMGITDATEELRFRVTLEGTTPIAEDGTCESNCSDHYFRKIPAAEDWTLAEVALDTSAAGMAQEGWGAEVVWDPTTALALQFLAKTAAPADVEFFIDQLELVSAP